MLTGSGKMTWPKTGKLAGRAPNAPVAVGNTWLAVKVVPLIGTLSGNALKKACVLGADMARNWGVGTRAIWSWMLRTRIHSVELKKKSLSFITKPPTE